MTRRMQVQAVDIAVGRESVRERRPAGNVVPFLRPDAGMPPAAPAVMIDGQVRLITAPPGAFRGVGPSVFLVASLLLHAGVFAAFQRQAPPLASIGVQSISVEIVLGGDRAAGAAKVPVQAESTINSVASQGEAAELVKPETARQDLKLAEAVTPVEPLRETPRAVEAKPVQQHEVREVPNVAAPKPAPAEVTPPPLVTAAELQAPPLAETFETPPQVQPAAEPPKAAEKPPEVKAVTAPPRKKPAVVERRKKSKGEDSRTRESRDSSASAAASGIGRGRSDTSSNYNGLLKAHLMRNLYYPPEAKRAGHEGIATVSFVIEPSGRVNSISLTRSTGIPSLDREAVALVSRSAPLPPPPSGQSYHRNVPINFHIAR